MINKNDFAPLRLCVKQKKTSLLFVKYRLSRGFHLFILGLLLSLLPSCSPNYLEGYSKLENTDLIKSAVFDNNFKKATYKTKLTLMGNQLSGILLIKKTKEDEFRFVFVSEIGIKYFDLGIKPLANNYLETSDYIMQALNKGNVEQMLFDDFGKLVKPSQANPTQTFFRNKTTGIIAFKLDEINSKPIYFMDAENNKTEKIVWESKVSGKSQVLLSNYKNNLPAKIEIENKKYGLGIVMKLFL